MKFPWMRDELIHTLKALSDRNYQQSAWVKGQFPPGIEYDSFDLAVHFLFDDTCLAEDSEGMIGYCLLNKKEAMLVRCVTDSIDKLLSELGNELTDFEYISSPQWERVLGTSATAYEFIRSNEI